MFISCTWCKANIKKSDSEEEVKRLTLLYELLETLKTEVWTSRDQGFGSLG
jgi:hypothetical protein